MTREEVHEIAEAAAQKVAKVAVHDVLTALGFDLEHVHEEQQVWAFARKMHKGTTNGLKAFLTGTLTAIATAIVGWIWYLYGPHRS